MSWPERVTKLVVSGAPGLWVEEHPPEDLFRLVRDRDAMRALLFHDPNGPIASLIMKTNPTEAELLASIDWPNDGYRLFDISVLEVGQSWPGPMLESNALCLPRASWKALGGYEARFSSPGGGAANPDMFSRACALPDVQLIKIANEGTFHQVHGGIATNATDHAIFRKLALEYMKIRKKPLAPVRQPGWLFDPRTDLVTRP